MLGSTLRIVLCVHAMQMVYGQECSDYEVVVTGATSNTFFEGSNVTAYCATNATHVTFVQWSFEEEGVALTEVVYNVVFSQVTTATATATGTATAGFENEIIGAVVDVNNANHSLTIINAKGKYFASALTCTVKTDVCSRGLSSELQINLKDAVFKGLHLQPNAVEPGRFTCFAISDPKSEVSFSGLNSPKTSCARVSDDKQELWNCSVTTTVTGNTKVPCTATFMGSKRASTWAHYCGL